MFEMIVPRYDIEFRPWRGLFEDWIAPSYAIACEDWNPDSNIVETDKSFVVTMELPGIDMKKTDISYKDGEPTVKGEKLVDAEEGASCVCSERFSGSFFRNFVVSGKVDADKIEATYKDGILKLILPKSEDSIPKKIEVH
jgi:HSP20 family protein